jgi:hypothetical protein
MPDFNALLMGGFQAGREMKRQEGERNALAGLVNGDDKALGDLATYNPQMAFQVRSQQDQQRVAMAKQQRELLEQGKKAVGQAALQIAQLPEGERPAAWDSAIDYLVGQGWDGLQQFRGKYSAQSLMGVISEAGLSNELRTATQPSYQVIPEGGTLVNTRDPAAVQQFGAPQQSSSAPSGGPRKQPVQISTARPPNMDDSALIAQARAAIEGGANVDDVFRQLKAWGVKP